MKEFSILFLIVQFGLTGLFCAFEVQKSLAGKGWRPQMIAAGFMICGIFFGILFSLQNLAPGCLR